MWLSVAIVISKQILYGVPVGPSRTLPTKQLVLFLNGSRQSVISMTVYLEWVGKFKAAFMNIPWGLSVKIGGLVKLFFSQMDEGFGFILFLASVWYFVRLLKDILDQFFRLYFNLSTDHNFY